MADPISYSHSSNNNIPPQPISKKVNPGEIGKIAKNSISQQNSLDSSKSKIKGQHLETNGESEKIQIPTQCPNKDGTSKIASFDFFPSIINKNGPKEELEEVSDDFEDDFNEDQDDFLENLDEEHDVLESMDNEKKAVQREVSTEIREVSEVREEAIDDLQSRGIIFDRIVSDGKTGYILVKNVDVNSSAFKQRLQEEEQKLNFKKDASVDKIKIGKKDIAEFSRGIGLLQSKTTAALPPEILKMYPHGTKVILLDDLSPEVRDQIDDLIIQNKLPASIPVRNAVAMTAQDQKAIQKMVASYFTLSLQLYVLQNLANQNALRTTSKPSSSSPTIDKGPPHIPKTRSTRIASQEKKPKEKKVDKKQDNVEKSMKLKSQERARLRKTGDEIRKRESERLRQLINEKWDTYDLKQYFNDKEDCLKFFLESSIKMNSLDSLQRSLSSLNETLRKELRLNDEERDTFIKLAMDQMDSSKSYDFQEVVMLIHPKFTKSTSNPELNEKNFSDPIKEKVFIQKLNRVFRVHTLIS